ncbi:c-type cytochrome [Pseudomonas sp. RGM2987]|uniref:c-type cytochrome n=1 Tax=Pseudomonas sp. RGM2987 TaxID=2930090 RepID=UPI001FD6556D|nr:c-type cytochrome [Pseudomonas sp. RGM2987]MCJ8203165.1 c-type cytochrome [Pseudomonas sp. RGM2987]
MPVSTHPTWLRTASIVLLGALLSGCGEEAKPLATTVFTAMPADAALAQVYDSSCKLCHANPGAGAPLTRDTNAWAPRVAQGAETLLDHAINGYNGMPPMGLCMHCSEEQFLALISFMSGEHFQ